MKRTEFLEKFIIIVFDTISFLTFCALANLFGSLFVGVLLFSIFAIINCLIPGKYRMHANRLLHCFILSILFLLYCILVYKIALNYMSNIEAMIFLFYWLY